MASKVKSIREACAIVDEIFSLLLLNIVDMKTEKDIDDFIRRQARKRKLKIAFPPVVASGKNAAEIHHKPNKGRLKRGFLVLDFGVKVNGYCSDMTRTIFLGKARKDELLIYDHLLEVQKAAVKKAKIGGDCFEIDYFVRKKLHDYRVHFVHSLGHGVGQKIHEDPNLSPKTCHILKKNEIITIEPGIYIKNKFGIRIEDTILVGKTAERLTKSPKQLIQIDLKRLK